MSSRSLVINILHNTLWMVAGMLRDVILIESCISVSVVGDGSGRQGWSKYL